MNSFKCSKCKSDSEFYGSFSFIPYLEHFFCNDCGLVLSKLIHESTKKTLEEFIQPERLNPEGTNNSVCDSLNSMET